ncbi:MAG: Calx-beta domain-containing protein, partial [Woeseiaceae bacterium]
MPVAATPGFKLDSAEYFVRENATALAVQINRQGDVSTEASVEWTTVADSAEPPLDYVNFNRRRVLFAAGEKTKTVFVPIVADATAERNEYFRVALSRPGEDMILAQPFTATVVIIDDDV